MSYIADSMSEPSCALLALLLGPWGRRDYFFYLPVGYREAEHRSVLPDLRQLFIRYLSFSVLFLQPLDRVHSAVHHAFYLIVGLGFLFLSIVSRKFVFIFLSL